MICKIGITIQMCTICIVGGGITGLYAAYKLSTRFPSATILVFEASNRLGGRIWTEVFSNEDTEPFYAEMGAMRFEWNIQPRFRKLVEELQVSTEPFVSLQGPKLEYTYNVESLFELEKIIMQKSSTPIMHLVELACVNILSRILNNTKNTSNASLLNNFKSFNDGLLTWIENWKGDEKTSINIWSLLTEDHLKLLSYANISDKKQSYQMAIWNFLKESEVLSDEAVRLILDEGTFFHDVHRSYSVSDWLIRWIHIFQSNHDIRTVKGGVETLVNALSDKLKQKSNVQIQCNTQVTKITTNHEDYSLEIKTQDSTVKIIDCQKVVFTLPAKILRKILTSENVSSEITDALNSVDDFSLSKYFFQVKDPWWKDDEKEMHKNRSRCPAREIHYKKQSDKLGTVMLYCDNPSQIYWEPLDDDDEERKINFAKLFKINPERITQVTGCNWAKVPFIETSIHFWKVGSNKYDVCLKLRSFSLKNQKSTTSMVHVCGGAYSYTDGFIEGGLQTVDELCSQL
jgi:monoamine oxidase